MVSEVLKEEIRLTYERLRLSIIILVFWVVLTTLDFMGVIELETETNYFLAYAIIASTAIIFLILGLGIQAEPLIRQVIKNRKNIDEFWESEEKLKPDLEKRAKASEAVVIFGIILMLVALLFVIV